MTPAQWLAKIRTLCLSLPGTVEKASWGHPNWAVGSIYAAFEDYDGRPSLCALASKEEQSLLVLDDRLFVPPRVGARGWVGVWLDKRPAWSLVAALLRAAHGRATAAPRARSRTASRSRSRAQAHAQSRTSVRTPAAKKGRARRGLRAL
jgi:hypothetical protein